MVQNISKIYKLPYVARTRLDRDAVLTGPGKEGEGNKKERPKEKRENVRKRKETERRETERER